MNLGQIKTKVKNLLNYSVNNDEFNTELTELINDAFGTIAIEAEWPFMNHEIDRTLHGRVTNTGGTATNGSANVTTATAFFLDWMVGQRLTIGSVIYDIVRVASTTSAYIDRAFEATTGTYAFVADEVYVWLPEDCNYVIEIGAALRQANTWPGTFKPVFRTEAGKYALNDDAVGIPSHWTTADAVAIPTPREAPTFGAVVGAWTAGTYEWAMTYSRNGYHGTLSPIKTQVLSAALRPQLQLAAIQNQVGYKRNIWTRVSSTAPWRLFDAGLDESAHTTTYTVHLGASSEFDSVNERYHDTDGQVQRVRVYPLAAADTAIRMRYMRRFIKMVEDTDTPSFFPAQTHELITFIVAETLANKLNQVATEKFCAKKGMEHKRTMAAKYLTPGNRDIVKGSSWGRDGAGKTYGLVTWR